MKERGKIQGKRKNVLRIGILCLLLLFGLGSFPGKRAQAASAVVTLSTGSNEAIKGETFSLVVTLESSEEIGNVEMFIVFDSSKVAFQSDGKYTLDGDGLVLISDWDEASTGTRKKYSMEFKARQKGECRFSIGDKPAVYLAGSKEQVSISSVNLDMEILEEERQEEEDDREQEISVIGTTTSDRMAQLKSLVPSVGDLEPTFKKDITSYSLTVPNGISTLSLSALPQDEEADVAIEGNDNLEVGENTVTVTVKASNGAKKTYTIKVVRKAEEALEETEGESLQPQPGIHCAEGEDGLFLTQYLKVTVMEPEEEEIPEGYMETNIRMDGHSIVAYMPEDDIDSEFYLIYGRDEEGNTGFFQYNRVELTMKAYVPSYSSSDSLEPTIPAVNASFQVLAVIVALAIACAGLSAALLLQIWKQRRRREKEEEEDFFRDFL